MNIRNEQGVVAIFSQTCVQHGYEILDIGIGFPDALVLYKGAVLRVEFEYKASNFNLHNHSITDCDLIICWENDWARCPISILELSKGWIKTELTLIDRLIAENNYLKRKLKSLQTKATRKKIKSATFDCTICKESFVNPRKYAAHIRWSHK